MPAEPAPSRIARWFPPLWTVLAAFGVVAMIAFAFRGVLLPAGFPHSWIYLLIGVVATVAAGLGVLYNQPAHRLPWAFIVAGQAVFVLGDLAYLGFGRDRFPSLADVGYLGGYPLLAAGMLMLVRLRTGWRSSAATDAMLIGASGVILSWLFLVNPMLELSTAGLLPKAVLLVYPLADLAILAMALLLILGGGPRLVSYYLLTGALTALLFADVVYADRRLTGDYRDGGLADTLWLLSYLLLAAAALHPSMRRLDQRGETNTEDRRQFPLLLAAALLTPAMLLLHEVGGHRSAVALVTAGCALLFLLVLVRLAELVNIQRELAITDSLTGLHTRRFMEAMLRVEVARAERTGRPLGMLLLDIDRFKDVNDQYGHRGGDLVLREVARRLRAACRPGDIVARYGGEEFAVLLPNVDVPALTRLGDRVRTNLATEPIPVVDTLIPVTASIGLAVAPEHGRTPDELTLTADRALYAAKRAGRDRIVVGAPARSDRGPATPVAAVSPATEYLIALADDVDVRTGQGAHARDVSAWAGRLADVLGLDAAGRSRCELAGRLHDIGKVGVPDTILRKPGPLTPDEWAVMRAHPQQGARLLRLDGDLADIAVIVGQHHERFDGGGYPDQLTGEDIALEARIIAVCDAWTAMRTSRVYRTALVHKDAIAELLRHSGSQFDPVVVNAFLGLVGQPAPVVL